MPLPSKYIVSSPKKWQLPAAIAVTALIAGCAVGQSSRLVARDHRPAMPATAAPSRGVAENKDERLSVADLPRTPTESRCLEVRPVSFQTEHQGDSAEPIGEGRAIDGNEQEPLANPLAPPAGSVASSQRRSVDYYVSIALAGHPKIVAARSRVRAAANVIDQVRALPDPMFNNVFWPIEDQALQTAGGRMAHQLQLSQQVPWPEKLHAKGDIAVREVQMARAEVARLEREVTESVRLAYYELWYANEAIAVVAETRSLIDDLSRVAEARYRSGGSQQDVLRARLEADRLDDQLIGLVRQKRQAQADLAALVQQPATLSPEPTAELGLRDAPARLEELLGMAEQCSPELQALAAEIRRDRQRQRLACLQQFPDLQLGVNYGIVDDDRNVISPVANGHDNVSFGVGVTLPIWRRKIDAGIREAACRTTSSIRRLEAERDGLQGRLRRLTAQADALVQQIDLYENRIIPRTVDTLELSVADYRGKGVDFYSLIETYRELLMFETQLARIRATLASTFARIERTVGCPDALTVKP